MTATALRPYQQKALDTCNGVIEIAENEMLLRGLYITHVMKPRMAASGSVCGGRKACLVGSMFLAHGGFKDIESTSMSPAWRGQHMKRRPGLRLAYKALNEAAYRRAMQIQPRAVRDEVRENQAFGRDEPREGWAEWFFERFLTGRRLQMRAEVVRVASDAKTLIELGEVR